MKQNFYNEKERQEYIDFIDSIRNNTDVPRIYLPFIIGTSSKFSPTAGCSITDIDEKVVTAIKVIFKSNTTDKEKRDKIKEVINNFIDYAFDTYEIYKEEIGLNKEAKVNRKKEVQQAKKHIQKQDTLNKISHIVEQYNWQVIETYKDEIKNINKDFPFMVNIENNPVIISKAKISSNEPIIEVRITNSEKEKEEV